MGQEGRFADAIAGAVSVTKDIGRAIEVVESHSKALKTVMTRHERGFSIYHYRRYFSHINGVEIPNSSEWVLTRCQHWAMGEKLFDIADETCTVLADPVGIPGDIE